MIMHILLITEFTKVVSTAFQTELESAEITKLASSRSATEMEMNSSFLLVNMRQSMVEHGRHGPNITIFKDSPLCQQHGLPLQSLQLQHPAKFYTSGLEQNLMIIHLFFNLFFNMALLQQVEALTGLLQVGMLVTERFLVILLKRLLVI